MNMKRKVNVLDGWRTFQLLSLSHDAFFSAMSSRLTPPSKIENILNASRKSSNSKKKMNKYTIFFPFASHFNFTIGICSRERSDEKKVSMSNYPSLIEHYLLVSRFYLLRNFLFWHESIRRRRCVIETVFCDTELLNWVQDGPSLKHWEIFMTKSCKRFVKTFLAGRPTFKAIDFYWFSFLSSQLAVFRL